MSGFILETSKLEASYTIPMLLTCPICGARHIDEGPFAEVPHHTHACQRCGHVWRPAKVNTHGVQFLPGYRNGDDASPSLPVEELAAALEKLITSTEDLIQSLPKGVTLLVRLALYRAKIALG